MQKLTNFYSLRAKGVRFNAALKAAEIDIGNGILFAILIVLLLAMVGFIDRIAEERAEPHRKQAAENLKAFNLAMKGRPFLIEDGDRALFTCPALESKI